jgi:uncharacterized membrane protein (Fun14 family)
MAKKNDRKSSGAAQSASLQFSRINLAFGVGALLTITLGYWLLAQGSITMAPILLVVGYVFLVPLAIIL